MKKILYFITQSEFGGAQRYVFDLASNLSGEFETAVAMGGDAEEGQLIKKLKGRGIKYFIIPHLKRSISPASDILALFEIIKLIKQFQPDIIHLNSSKISILGSVAALCVARSTLRVIYTVHGWVFNEPLPIFTKVSYKFAEKFTARFKDKIICVSEFDRQAALRLKIAPASKLVTIHNGLTPIEFYSKKQAREIISKVTNYELRVTSLLIGSIGNLYPIKGFEYLIEAANLLINQHHLPLAFVVIGDGSERKKLENLIARHSLQNNFILAGQIDDAAKLLPAFDIYVCSSVKEGLPYSILEAIQAGLPIVSTGAGGIPEMIEPEKTGLLVKPANAGDLAEKIKTLLENKTLAQELGRSAKAKAITNFALEKMIKETKKICNQ